MADINDMFPSNWLKAGDVSAPIIVTISHIASEDVNGDQKNVLYFVSAQKGLILNRTNANLIAELHGRDHTQWAGKQVELFKDRVSFKGDMVDAVRVRRALPPEATAPTPPPSGNEPPPPTDADVPF